MRAMNEIRKQTPMYPGLPEAPVTCNNDVISLRDAVTVATVDI